MKKIISCILALVLTLTVFSAALSEGKTSIRLGGLKGPTSIGMVKLLDDSEKGLTANEYQFTMAGSADQLTAPLLKGELDILAVPANLGSILYNRSNGAVKMIAVNTLGVIYLVEKGGETVTDWESLRGKTVFSTGKGSTPEYAFSYLLSAHGLSIDTDVTMEWKSEPTEIVAEMSTMDSAVALLPQPFVTVAQSQLADLRVALDLTASWDELDNGSRMITAGLIVRTDFALQHPEALAAFLNEYAASTRFVNENTDDASLLVEKYGIVKAAVARTAIPYCNIVCITGAEMKDAVSGYFTVLFDQNPASLGGSIPGDEFYWMNE
ncbi:MAG: ABC transporter substrate-binding protein [Clostridia bacterium]|nr:ABC transporter substrate-binding protein [Clostridia bacterium]